MGSGPPHDDGAREGWALEAMKPTSVGGLRCGHRLTDPRLNLGSLAKPTSQEHPDEKVLWFREGQFDAAEILSGEACTVSLRDPPGSIKLLHEWSLSPDFPKLAGFMIGDESRFRRILGVSKDGDNVIYKVRCARVDGQPTIRKIAE